MEKLLLTLAFMMAAAPARGANLGTDHGSVKGLTGAAPEWGLGLQIGTRGASGIQVQKIALADGAVDLGFGFGGGTYSLYGDFVYFLDADWTVAALPEAGGYDQTRGRVMPYFGGGLMIAHGISLHVPLGVQYTMLKDPVTFYGGGAICYGLIDGEKIELRPQALAGARLLL